MTGLEIVLLCALVASAALHVIAPKTKTKADDKAVEILDAAIPLLPKAEAKPQREKPAVTPVTKTETKPDGTVVRDHR